MRHMILRSMFFLTLCRATSCKRRTSIVELKEKWVNTFTTPGELNLYVSLANNHYRSDAVSTVELNSSLY